MPVSAFITFEEEDGKIMALKTKNPTLLLNKSIKMEPASEPTDIIWENRHFTRFDYCKRMTFAFSIIFVLLLGSFIVVFLVASYSSRIASTYPTVDCTTL